MKGKQHSKQAKRKISKKLKGRLLSEETKKKLSVVTKGRYAGEHHSPQTEFKKGHKINLGRNNSPATEFHKREKHPAWKGGMSREPYPIDFDNELKELIRKRDKYQCQLCQKKQNEQAKELSVHHIDYNKSNLNPDNLITICNSCNSKVNFNRGYWTRYFQAKVESYEQKGEAI